MACDGKITEECLTQQCRYVAVPYLLGEQDPVVVCGKPRQFSEPLTPLQEFLKQHEEEWLKITGVHGAVITTNQDGNEASIMILAAQPDKVTLPETDFSVYVCESVI